MRPPYPGSRPPLNRALHALTIYETTKAQAIDPHSPNLSAPPPASGLQDDDLTDMNGQTFSSSRPKCFTNAEALIKYPLSGVTTDWKTFMQGSPLLSTDCPEEYTTLTVRAQSSSVIPSQPSFFSLPTIAQRRSLSYICLYATHTSWRNP